MILHAKHLLLPLTAIIMITLAVVYCFYYQQQQQQQQQKFGGVGESSQVAAVARLNSSHLGARQVVALSQKQQVAPEQEREQEQEQPQLRQRHSARPRTKQRRGEQTSQQQKQSTSSSRTPRPTSTSTPIPNPSPTPTLEASKRHERLEILLDRNNFVLSNRCSMSRLWVRAPAAAAAAAAAPKQKQRPKAKFSVGARQQKLTSGGQMKRQLDSARMKLLSTIITVESRQQQPDQVRLRANLTQLYICFDQTSGDIEPRVDGSGPSCLFNELTLDHRHIKYRSVANASWFLGFDKLGNPISGQELIKRDVEDAAKLDDAIGRERCYLFTKTNRLTTSTQFFPEALELIRQQQQPKPNVSSADYTSEQPSQMYQSALVATMFNKKQSADQTSPIVATQATGSGRPVYAFNQKQLINMTRYRNILRYQLGLRGNQPLSDP